MNWNTLISLEELAAHHANDDVAIIDARFDLISGPDAGERVFHAAAIPNARYVDLDRDLSDHDQPAQFGRHPLPSPQILMAKLLSLGIKPEKQIVIYDAGSGAMAAARTWWLLRLLGYPRVAVLNGGLAAWQAKGLPLSSGANPQIQYDASEASAAKFDTTQIVNTQDIQSMVHNSSVCVMDARATERFRGEVEPLDKKPGHIPGAINRPFTDNLSNGFFKPVEQLREEFFVLIGSTPSEQTIHSCGSGVTACHNLLAMEYAGLHGSRVYPPSWSGWIADDNNPIVVGQGQAY